MCFATTMLPAERFHCGECEKSFGTVGHLNRHRRVHTGERPYKCNQCHKSFMRKDHLDDHCFSHTTQRPFSCNQCDMKFYTKQKLKRHEVLHDRPKRYVCEYCREAFVKKNQLSRHRVQHTGKQPFPCPEPDCDKAFSMPSALKRHQEHRHSLSTYLCIEPDCKAEPFIKFSQLQRHLKLHRPKHPHECDICAKRFRSSSSLNKHKPTHEVHVADRMVHKCRFPGCNAAYTSSGNLGTHVRSQHLNREAFVCELCKARFSVKSSYERHLRNLHGDDGTKQELRFFCRVCKVGFPSRAALRRHMRMEHKMSASHNEEACHAELGLSSTFNEEKQRPGNMSACPTIGEVEVCVGTWPKSNDVDLSGMNGTSNGTAIVATEIRKATKRKREYDVGLTGQRAEASQRGLDDIDDGVYGFEKKLYSKRQRFTVPSDEYRLSADGTVPIALQLSSVESPKFKARHKEPAALG